MYITNTEIDSRRLISGMSAEAHSCRILFNNHSGLIYGVQFPPKFVVDQTLSLCMYITEDDCMHGWVWKLSVLDKCDL